MVRSARFGSFGAEGAYRPRLAGGDCSTSMVFLPLEAIQPRCLNQVSIADEGSWLFGLFITARCPSLIG